MKRATVYRRGPAVLVHPSSRTTDGVWLVSEPCVRLSSDCSDVEMGNALLAALEESKLSVPHPTQWKGILQPLLSAAGVKSWKTFAKSAVCVEVEAQDSRVELIPTQNLGSDDGFQADESMKMSVMLSAGAAVIGASLRTVLANGHGRRD